MCSPPPQTHYLIPRISQLVWLHRLKLLGCWRVPTVIGLHYSLVQVLFYSDHPLPLFSTPFFIDAYEVCHQSPLFLIMSGKSHSTFYHTDFSGVNAKMYVICLLFSCGQWPTIMYVHKVKADSAQDAGFVQSSPPPLLHYWSLGCSCVSQCTFAAGCRRWS